MGKFQNDFFKAVFASLQLICELCDQQTVMDPVLLLKRTSDVDLLVCIFCQKRKGDLKTASEHCRNVAGDAMRLRTKYRDVDS